jgi:signal transduction histidine kinase
MNTRPEGFGLGAKLAAGLGLTAVVTAGALFVLVGPGARRAFVEAGDRLIDQSASAMHDLASTGTTQSAELLVDLIGYTADARARLLTDLPLDLYVGGAGDVEGLRDQLRTRDALRSERLRSNVQVLAREMERRSNARIDASTAELVAAQRELADTAASDLRRTTVLWTALIFAAAIGGLGFASLRVVVRPIRELRRAARAVAGGDLEVRVEARSRDEVGGLAEDFGSMVAELRASRAEIDRKNDELEAWNRNLEAEVARKTAHLETALADLHAAQARLVHAAKMASLGTLAGGVAHEFNNVIGGIHGCARLALSGEEDPERREMLEVIVRAAQRGAAVTEQLLHFARQRVDRTASVDVARVLDESLQLVEPRAQRSGVEIIRQGAVAAPLDADADALHQVFLNLATNAIQAMRGGGTLTVHVEVDGDAVSIGFEDSGAGIPAEALQHIFEPFWTSRDTDEDPEQRGTGLGLSVSHGLVEAHGGVIDVESVVGGGATFTVRLPVTAR